jgi:hypothetical protein
VVAVVVVYSDLAVEGALPGMLGRTYPLREGDVLFAGKPPQPDELTLDGGRRLSITHVHLFPYREEFEYVSRRHVAIEAKAGGEFLLMDFSTNGVFLMGPQQQVRRTKDQTVALHTFRGPETIVLGIDLRVQRDRKAKERAERHQLRVVPLGSASARAADVMETHP